MKVISSLTAASLCLLALVATSTAENTIYPALKGSLVESKGKKTAAFDDAPLANAKYYALYYSAAWCGPCRAFTPDLVRWYKRNKSKHPQFELIFVSSDRSEEEMAKYMNDDDMPWPALAYDKKSSSRALTKYSGPGIPCLVLIDDQGKVLADSYEGKNYLGPQKALETIEKTLKKGATANGTSGTSGASTGSSSFDEAFKKKPAATQ